MVSIEFIGKLDHFYFSKFADNTKQSMRRFFVEQYFENGAALFGRESSEELQDFRDASGERFRNLTDRQTLTIVQTAVQRTRNWSHMGSLDQAGFEYARLVATLDTRTSLLCLSIDGKLVRVGTAQGAIQRLNKLEPADFAEELYGSELAKQVRQDPSSVIREYLEDDGLTIKDSLADTGLGIPPFHPNCRTRMEGYFDYLD